MTAYWLEIDTRAVSTPLPLLAITGSSEPLVFTSALPSVSDVPGKTSECLVVTRSGHGALILDSVTTPPRQRLCRRIRRKVPAFVGSQDDVLQTPKHGGSLGPSASDFDNRVTGLE